MRNRPFYTSFAWAYDRIIAEPSAERYDKIAWLFAHHGIAPGSRLLDAGCGTGRYALEMATRGYQVTGLDLSSDLLMEARQKAGQERLPVTFESGDIRHLSAKEAFDGVLCRGVLNDLTDDSSRQAVFHAFVRILRQAGVLLLDVREWHSTAHRKTQEPLLEKQVETEEGALTFRSLTHLEHETRTLRIAERHQLKKGEELMTAEYEFAMRCWLQEELHTVLVQAGFDAIAYFGDYDPHVLLGATDHIVAVARLVSAPPEQPDATSAPE